MIRRRNPLPATAEEYLRSLDKNAFLIDQTDANPKNWDFALGYLEKHADVAYNDDVDCWYVVVIYKPTLKTYPKKTIAGSVTLLSPDQPPQSGFRAQKDGISNWIVSLGV